jgi:acylpyruvate hydrolase
MKLLSFAASPEMRVAAVAGERVVDLNLARAAMARAAGSRLPYAAADAVVPSRMEDLLLLGPDGLAAAGEALAWATAPDHADLACGPNGEKIVHSLADVRLCAPVSRPQKIIGIGLNYHDHCRETGGAVPDVPRSFGMFANALIGPGQDIVLPRNSRQMDWEAELVVVIGRHGKYLAIDEAMQAIAGYTAGNDVSARDHQKADPQTTRGKSGDTHAPIGPWIVTREEIPDPCRLAIELTVNGETKQRSNTGEMIFTPAAIVSFLSQYFTLAPGDLIFTGTPAGVGFTRKPPEFLRPGDRVEVTIEGIGTLANSCVAEPNRPAR